MNDDPLADKGVPRGYDLEVHQLKQRAGKMGDWALGMVHDAWRAYAAGDLTAAQAVLDRDAELDRLDDDMEHASVAFLVLRQPAAVDLRTAAALLKITTHLDRIGRLGFDMARLCVPGPLQGSAELKALLERMDTTVEAMVRQALEALVHDTVAVARGLFSRDDEVDRMHRQANRLVIAELAHDHDHSLSLSSHILVARHFERIADNACKVGEKTIYAVTGQRRSEYLPRHPSYPYVLDSANRS